MDNDRFDALSRSVSSRRTALAGLLGGAAALLGLGAEETGAHNTIPACRKIKDPKKKQACLKRARAHNKKHRCTPQSLGTTCAGRCGVWLNNCGKPEACLACAPGRTCLSNGGCAQTCAESESCPVTCPCGFANTEGTRACIETVGPCPPQTCSSSTECAPGYHCQPCLEGGPNFCFQLCTA